MSDVIYRNLAAKLQKIHHISAISFANVDKI